MTEHEPTYEYHKGEGWVAIYGFIATTCDGKRCYVYPRLPKKGEYYLNRSGDYWLNSDKTPNLESFAKEVGKFYRNDWSSEGFNPLWYFSDTVYVTLVWLD